METESCLLSSVNLLCDVLQPQPLKFTTATAATATSTEVDSRHPTGLREPYAVDMNSLRWTVVIPQASAMDRAYCALTEQGHVAREACVARQSRRPPLPIQAAEGPATVPPTPDTALALHT